MNDKRYALCLGDAANIVMGQSPPGETVSANPCGLPLLNGPTEFGPHHPFPMQFTTNARKQAIEGDLLFCVRGSTTGRMNWADQEYAIGRGVAAIRHRYVPELQPLVRAIVENWLPDLLSQATGSTFPNVSAEQLARIPYPCISESEQKVIARILASLDDKIELNRHMNETLEAIARAIFESWFVDFDPVRAKAEGREPAGIDVETAALFPDSFRDSNLGEIPEGWMVTCLETQIDIKHGYAFKGLYFREETTDNILLTPGNFAIGGGFKSDKLKYYNGPVPEDFVLGAGDLIVTMTDLSKLGDTLGYPAIIPPLIGSRYLHNQRLGKIIFRSGATIGKFILFQILCSESYRNHILGSASGTTVKHTSPGRIKQYEIVLPTKLIIKKYEQLANSLQDRIEANFRESLILTEIRGSLLPKLLSGQIQLMSFEVQEATHND